MLRKRSERIAQSRFVVEGARAVEQVLRNGMLNVDFLVMTGEFMQSLGAQGFLSGKTGAGKVDIESPVYTVTASVFNQIADTDTSQGLLAVCCIPKPAPDADILRRSGALLAVDQVQDPGNLGTIIRTAVWFGLEGLVLSPGTVDLFHPKVVRSTAGATGVIPWLETDLDVFLMEAAKQGWHIHLLDNAKDSQPYTRVARSDRDILVVGNEANGISQKVRTLGFGRVRIDPAGASTGVESLNASVAAAIVMAHFCRPRLSVEQFPSD